MKLDTASRTTQRYATAKIRNVAAIPATLVEFGVDPAIVLRRAGLDPNLFSNPENVMPYAALGRLMTESVEATGCESFGLRVGVNTKASSLGLTSLVSINSPTVRDALKVIVDTLKTSETGGTTFLDIRGGLASFGYAVTAHGVESVDQIVDGSIAIALQHHAPPLRARMAPEPGAVDPRPARDRGPFSKFFEAPVDYSEPSGCLVFDAATLDAPVRDRNPDYADILAPVLEEAAGQRAGRLSPQSRSSSAAGRRGRAVARQPLPGAGPQRAHARPSARSLRRHLFGPRRSKRDTKRRRLPPEGQAIAEIAAALGFAEHSAFTRAFKAWSGTTPARWRAERGGRP